RVVLLVGQQARAGIGEGVDGPGAALAEAGVDKAQVGDGDVVPVGVPHRVGPGDRGAPGPAGVVRPGGHHGGDHPVHDAEVGGPGGGEARPARLAAGGEDRGEPVLVRGGLGEELAAHHLAGRVVAPPAGEHAVVDRVVVVAGVVVGGDDVQPVGALGVAGVGVDVADLLALEELAGEGPGVAVVVGDQRAG